MILDRTAANCGARSAATATALASLASFFVDRPEPSRRTARRQRRRRIHHMFTAGNELLGEQIAEPARRFDRPRSALERRRPREQIGHLTQVCSDLEMGELGLVFIDRARRVEQLVWIDTDDHWTPTTDDRWAREDKQGRLFNPAWPAEP